MIQVFENLNNLYQKMNEIDIDNLTEDERRYDDMLLSILQREGKIEPFLDVVFKFLYRRQVNCKVS